MIINITSGLMGSCFLTLFNMNKIHDEKHVGFILYNFNDSMNSSFTMVLRGVSSGLKTARFIKDVVKMTQIHNR